MIRGGRQTLGVLLGFVVRLWVRSLRFRLVYDGWHPDDYPMPWVLAFLHGQQMALLRWRRRRETVVLVSLSDDGELQSHVMGAQGLEVVRGSTSRGGARGLATIVRRLRGGNQDAAFAVDGPRGPYGVVQGGALVAAARVRGVVVPLASAAASAHVLPRTWDRFEIPLPFTRVVVVLGPPLQPDAASPAAVAATLERARDRALREVAS